MEQKRNHDALLVTLADKNFIDQAKQLFSSVYWNAGWKGDYMLLAHEIPEKDLKWFRDKGILVKKCKPLYKDNISGYFSRHWKEYPPAIFSTFYILKTEFKKWKNIVYLESDIIVRASLDRLAKVKGFWARDIFVNYRLSDQFSDGKLPNAIRDNYLLKLHTFNPGIMAFSTEIIKVNSFRDLKELSDKYRKISLGDEGILNLFFYKNWKKLPLAYNIQPENVNFRCGISMNRVNGIILHFVRGYGPDTRPWDKKNPFYKEWKNNLERANRIDLNYIYERKEWSVPRVLFYSLYLYLRRFLASVYSFFHKVYILLKRISFWIMSLSLRIMGLIGMLIKNINPDLYHFLKVKKHGQGRTAKKS